MRCPLWAGQGNPNQQPIKGLVKIVLNDLRPSELKETSGDMSYLPDLLALRVGALQYETLNDTPPPLRTVRKVFWHLGRWWEPQPLRRTHFIASLRNFFSPSMMAGKKADDFHTHLLLPWNVATLRRRYPIAFSSAGISQTQTVIPKIP